MSHLRRLAVCALATLLGGAGQDAVFSAEDFAFFHENVLGTSCELRVRADSEDAARCAEERVLSAGRSANPDLQRLRCRQRVQPLASDQRPPDKAF